MAHKKDKEVIDMGDNCRLEFNRGGTLRILGDCNEKEINPVDITMYHRTPIYLEKEEK